MEDTDLLLIIYIYIYIHLPFSKKICLETQKKSVYSQTAPELWTKEALRYNYVRQCKYDYCTMDLTIKRVVVKKCIGGKNKDMNVDCKDQN